MITVNFIQDIKYMSERTINFHMQKIKEEYDNKEFSFKNKK